MPGIRLSLLALALALALPACRDDGDGQSQCDPTAYGPDPALQLCDITSAPCQCLIYTWVAKQRGSKLTQPPPTGSLTREEYRAVLAEQIGGTDDDEGTRIANALGDVLRFLGYNTSDQSFVEDQRDDRGGGVLGFYSTLTERVTIITSPDVALDDARAVSLLAHEYLHAQQDAEGYFDYVRLRVRDEDMLLTARAALEGEGELIENLAEVELAEGVDRDNWDWEGFVAQFQERSFEIMLDRENPFAFVDLFFPYPFGVEMNLMAYFREAGTERGCLFAKENDGVNFIAEPSMGPSAAATEEVARRMRSKALNRSKIVDAYGGDYRNVREQRCAFPTQTRQFLTRDFSGDARQQGYIDQIQPTYNEPALPEGYEFVGRPRPLGAFHTFVYFQFAFPDRFDPFDAFDAAVLLLGDRLYVARRSSDEALFGGWMLRFDSPAIASAVASMIADKPSDHGALWAVAVDENYVVVSVGAEESVDWTNWMQGLPADYRSFLADEEQTIEKTVPAYRRPEFPTRFY